MLSIANKPSVAIKYMKQEKDFFIVKDKLDQYDFYSKIVNSLQAYDKDGEPVDYIEKSISFNLNRFFDQLGQAVKGSLKM